MVRVALLVTVLAALCYTSQASAIPTVIPTQVRNTEFELRKGISDQIQQILDLIPKEVQDKIEALKNKFTESFQQFANEAEKGKTTAINVFEKAKENAKKLLQEGKKNVNQVLEKLKNVEQEIVTNYQYTLNDGIQNIKDTLGKLIKEELKQKLQERLDSFQGRIMNYANEVVKKFEGNANEILEKNDKVKELKNILDKSVDKLTEAIKNVKDEAGKVKRSVSDVIITTDRQQAKGIFGGLFDVGKNLVEGGKKGARDMIGGGLDHTKDIVDDIHKFLDTVLAPGQGMEETHVEDSTKEENNEDE
ncbi:hypothetical protein ALC57_07976 [Trachymyrmex cornetzi]|uniref:Uncharacterized protein n=1 Tax=Trachymyrmex cornetzi TaxID=471704 RepID=A0A195E2W0_9HYME|nr:hypothetical protein ALC57_07976 [Trachymyrmex cornetzi]